RRAGAVAGPGGGPRGRGGGGRPAAPRRPPLAAMAPFFPPGRASLDPVTGVVRALRPDGGWPLRPVPWIVAMDYDTGRRVVFGRDGAPAATLAEAVTASCSIPGWYAATVIGGRRYVGGGTCPPASGDR